MINRLLIFSLCLFVIGCNFDRERELALMLPATVVVENSSSEAFTIIEIYSTVDAGGAFALKGGSLAPGEYLARRVSELSYDIFVNKDYEIEVKCPSNETLMVKGDKIDAIEEKDWTLVLSFKPCPEPHGAK